MTTAVFYVMRHGASEANLAGRAQGLEDIPLAELGRQQARAAGEALRAAGLTAIYGSPLQRAWETALLVGEGVGVEVEAMPGLRARDIGAWKDKTREEFRAMWEDKEHPFRSDPHFVPPGGESLFAADERIFACVDQAVTLAQGPILFVTHLVGAGALLGRLLGTRPALKNAEVWAIDPETKQASCFFQPSDRFLFGAE